MKELYVKKGDNEYEKVEFKDLLSLQFDYDGDGVLLITEENYLRLKMAIDLNDRYSVGNADNEKTAQYYIKNDYLKGGHLVNDIGVIKEVCKRIDKENSTHLSVVGNRKIKISNKTNNGIDIMAKRIANVENLEQRLKDGDPSLVQELGGKVGERHAVSFASKFCTEVSLTAFGNTKFAKFDSVMRDVLPIYAYNYLGKTYWKKNHEGQLRVDVFRGQLREVSGRYHGRCRCDKTQFSRRRYRQTRFNALVLLQGEIERLERICEKPYKRNHTLIKRKENAFRKGRLFCAVKNKL